MLRVEPYRFDVLFQGSGYFDFDLVILSVITALVLEIPYVLIVKVGHF